MPMVLLIQANRHRPRVVKTTPLAVILLHNPHHDYPIFMAEDHHHRRHHRQG